MDQLAQKQVEVAESLQKAFSNTKKDSKTRKTSEYVKKRKDDITASWKTFTQQHAKILELDCQDHHYMKLNYYTQTHKLVMDYEKYLDEIDVSLAHSSPVIERKQLEQPRAGPPPKTTPGTILVRKQVSRINRLNKLLEDTESEMSSEHSDKYWEFKKDSINQQWLSVQQLQEDIELEGDTGLTIDSFQDVEEKVLDVVENLCEIISNEPKPSEKLQLPRIDVPHFDGKFESWSSFHDLFVRFIHTNKKLGNVEKMQFLKSRVKGEASRLLQHLPITDINYESAWTIIQNRYNNKRMILFTYINNIFSVPKVTSSPVSELKLIYDTVVEGMRGINTLGINTDTWDPMVLHILQEKLDRETLRLYEQSLKCPKEFPKLEDMLNFVETRFTSLEMQRRKGSDFTSSATIFKKESNLRKDNFRVSHHTKSQNCPFCKEGHKIYACKKFTDQPVKDRISFVKNRNLCANCLYHDATSKCFSKKTCSRCKRQHHTLLHQEKNEEERPIQVTTITQVPSGNKKNSEVLLTTALIKVKKYEGTWEYLRALIDPGSQCSFITEEAAESLGRPRKRACLTISGVGGETSQISTKGRMTVDMKPRMSSNFHLRCDLLILNKLTSSTPSEDTEEIISTHDTNLMLADPTYNISGPIDILIGSDIVPSILKSGIKKQKSCLLQNTEFGWIVSGPSKLNGEALSDNLRSMIVITEEPQLTRFWETEEVISDIQPTIDNESCEAVYDTTTIRGEDGRYTVRLPFKESVIDLGESKKTAMARLLQMEKKFRNNPRLEADYKNFMKEYEEMGHMVIATEKNNARYYIPHHAVIKEDSTTTKLRVVFDASARSSTGKCLNDIMFTGPRLQEDLSQILLRWRKHEITLTADIEKMYRQVKMHRDDQLFQTILWRGNTTEPIKEYQLTTVTYGTSSAPYLAVKTLQRLASDELENHTMASQVTTRDYYVDDLLTGADSIEQARVLQQEMIILLRKGGFNLRKWQSNRRELINSLPDDLQDKDFLEISADDTKKMLGVHWAPVADKFKYRVKVVIDENPTKRKILSDIARLYDPLGWLQPIIITAKLLIQELWKNDNKWDEVAPPTIKTKWIKFQTELPRVEEIDIPRWIHFKPENVSTEIHGFCDASEAAYGAVLYSRTTDKNGKITITLLNAKSKVAPIKMKKTLPRLELCGAALLAKLIDKSKMALDIPNVQISAWSDSMIVLAWIKGNQEKWNSFVQNRVSQIREVTDPRVWNHVKSEDNPADLVSRGVNPNQLKEKSIWWNGPDWLQTLMEEKQENVTYETNLETRRKVKVFKASIAKEPFYEKYSSLPKLLRIIAYCKRFINNSLKKGQSTSTILTTNELAGAEKSLIRMVQQSHFCLEITALQQNRPITKASKLISLMPFVDESGVLRVGGRLQNSHLPYEEMHPAILPYSDPISKLIVRHTHEILLHGGNQLTLASVRRKYWILKGKLLVRQIVNKCVRCSRFRKASAEQLMGNLPEHRVTASHPFTHTGLDYAGPIQIRISKGRGIKSYKGFISIFVCMATKAIHLEAVSDMTTAAFLAALRRFTSRRGHCSHIYSDNGTTFVGANTILDEEFKAALQQPEFLQPLASEGTEWHFIPPGAPHFGGIWEAGVKSTKFHLKRVVGNTTLTFEEMTTVLCQIEACLNSRPLCINNSQNPEEQVVLTPSHFLIGRGSVLQADQADIRDDVNPSTRWKLVQKLKRDFWKVWSSEYVHTLQQRYKWKSPSPNLQPDDVVLIKDENSCPTKWPLAKVTELHPGKDGKVRVVSVKTANGNQYKRPITKLCPLPIDHDLDTAETRSAKVNNTRTSVNMLTYIILFTTLGIITCCTASPYTIKSPGPGIYLEHMGEALLHRGIFRLDIPINISRLEEQGALANKTLKQFQEVCQVGKQLTEIKCDLFIQELENKYNELQVNMQIITNNGYHFRAKRGVLGQFLTSVFGVNDEIYTDIADLNKNQQRLIQASKHQTAIMVKSLTSLNKTEQRITEKLNQFTQKLNHGLNEIHQMEAWYRSVDVNKINIHILYVHQLAMAVINEVEDHVKKLIKIVHHQGDVLDFLTIAEFHRAITNTTMHLPPQLTILTNHIIRLSLMHEEKQIMVHACYHIAEKSSYEVINVTPIPQRVKSSVFAAIVAVSPLLAVDYNKQHYFELSYEEFQQAVRLDDSKVLLSTDIIHDMNQDPSCIIDIIYSRTKTNTCPQRSFTIRNVLWKQLFMRNTWLFVANTPTRVSLDCEGQRSDLWLNETGILQVDQDCTVDTGRKLLKTEILRKFQGVRAFHMPLILPPTDSWRPLDHPSIKEQEPVFKLDEDFTDLLKDENSLAFNLTNDNWESIRPHVTTSGVSVVTTLLIVGSVLIIMWIIRCRRNKESSSKPNFILARQDV